jgi:hypothetical protein
MMKITGRTLTAAGFFVVFLISLSEPPRSAEAGVVVSDQVTGVGKPVFVKAVTRGLIFTKGGRRVAIRIDDKPAQYTLSGADGAAFIKYHPDTPGFHRITAVSENEKGTGTILVLAPDESVIVIGIEGGLQKSLFAEEKREEARKVVEGLSQTHRLVYLTRWVGIGLVKNWLEKHRFPRSVALRWRGEGVFKQMEKNGVRVHAVIGSGALLRAAPDAIENRFTFDENDASAVGSWEEIRAALEDRKGKDDPAAGQGKNAAKP